MEVKTLTNDLHDQYDNFLLKNRNNLIYSSRKYIFFLEKLLDCKSIFLLVMDEGLIIASLTIMYKDGKLGRVYNSLPFYGSNGGIISNSFEATSLLINEYNKLILADDVASSNYIENPINKISLEKLISYNEEDFRIGQFTPLNLKNPNQLDNKDLLIQSFHYKTRNSIRKAIKNEIEIVIDNESMDFVKKEHIKGMIKINGKAKPNLFFDNIFKSFNAGEDYNIFTAKKNNNTIAAVLVFYFNKTVEYFVPVTSEGYKNYQPNSLIIYEAMIDAMNKGFHYWNWGGTWESQSGVYSFKNRWNTSNIKYKYYNNVKNIMVYKTSKEEILEDYYGFYILPFNKLSK